MSNVATYTILVYLGTVFANILPFTVANLLMLFKYSIVNKWDYIKALFKHYLLTIVPVYGIINTIRQSDQILNLVFGNED